MCSCEHNRPVFTYGLSHFLDEISHFSKPQILPLKMESVITYLAKGW